MHNNPGRRRGSCSHHIPIAKHPGHAPAKRNIFCKTGYKTPVWHYECAQNIASSWCISRMFCNSGCSPKAGLGQLQDPGSVTSACTPWLELAVGTIFERSARKGRALENELRRAQASDASMKIFHFEQRIICAASSCYKP